MGIVLLPTCLSLSAALAKLAVNLDKRPELTAHLIHRKSTVNLNDDGESQKTLVEDTAELLQRAFTTCLAERSTNASGTDRDGRPEGKKKAIYSFANLVLKLLSQVSNCIFRQCVHSEECVGTDKEHIVPKNASCVSDIYQHRPAFSFPGYIPGISTSNISVLSRPVRLFHQSIPSGTGRIRRSLPTMSRSMYQSTSTHTNLSDQCQSDLGTISVRFITATACCSRSRSKILAHYSSDRPR